MDNNNNYAETFRTIEGRTYRNEVNVHYYLPSDDKEMDRIGAEHFLLRYIWRGNFSSKIKERLIEGNTKVIDLGCGSGEWLIDMSLKYPLSTFIGIDISASFPSKESTPDNLAFLKHNLIEHPGVPFPDKTFDYVFLRNLAFKVRDNDDWDHVINEAVRVINLNGCIEVMNYDLYKDNSTEICGGPIFSKLLCSMNGLHERDNMRMPTAAEIVAYLDRTNQITNIQIEEKVSPMGSWGGKVGEVMLLNIIAAFKGFKAFLQPFMNITGDEYDSLVSEVTNECSKYKTRCYTYRVYGIKC